MQLYNLVESYQAIQQAIAGGELTDEECTQALESITDELVVKVENIGYVVLNSEAMVTALDTEIKRLTQRKSAIRNHADRLKQYLSENMTLAEKEEFTYPTFTVKFHKNPPSVEVYNEGVIPAGFTRIIPERLEVDKRGILDYWKAMGATPAGVQIICDKKRLVIR